jgi:hypothetical protein
VRNITAPVERGCPSRSKAAPETDRHAPCFLLPDAMSSRNCCSSFMAQSTRLDHLLPDYSSANAIPRGERLTGPATPGSAPVGPPRAQPKTPSSLSWRCGRQNASVRASREGFGARARRTTAGRLCSPYVSTAWLVKMPVLLRSDAFRLHTEPYQPVQLARRIEHLRELTLQRG